MLPREPNAPPTYWLMTRTLSGSMPSRCATAFLSPCTNWLDSCTMSRSPIQVQLVVNSSSGLWCCVGVAYSASSTTSAPASAEPTSPLLGTDLCCCETLVASSTLTPSEPKVALGASAAYAALTL